MRRCAVVAIAVGLASIAASPNDDKPCLKAEINPITGHTICIEPLGAPVEAPPSSALSPCKLEQSTGNWSWAPDCKPEPAR
jgi:hypothetical protein